MSFDTRIPMKRTFLENNKEMKKTVFLQLDFTLSSSRIIFIRRADNIFGALARIGGIRNILMSLAIFIGRSYS
jgi:hypothetical protein